MKGITNQLPGLFIERLNKIIPSASLDDCLQSFVEPNLTSFRIHTLKHELGAIKHKLHQAGFMLTPVIWHPEIYIIPDDQRRLLTESTLYKQGMVYIQNPSSLVPIIALDPHPEEEILDLAAAPGGKTIYMAERMRNQGRIAAVEAVKSRFFRLKNNLENYGVTIAQSYCKDGSSVWKNCPERFDRVLLDAPCSSEARFNLNKPKSFIYWSEKKIKEMQRKQKKLLYSAIQSLKPQGTLVYSTCSFAPEENEVVIQELLTKFPGKVQIETISLPFENQMPGLEKWDGKEFARDLKNAVRILPNKIMKAFFVCKLRKTASTLSHPL